MQSLRRTAAYACLGWIVLMPFSLRSGAAEPVCIREHDATRLATLHVHTCLLGFPAEGDQPARAIGVRRILRNVSDKPITLIFSGFFLLRAGIIIIGPGAESMHKSMHAPDAPGFVFLENEYVPLSPKAATEETYLLSDILSKPPVPGTRYLISSRTDYDYRTAGDKDDLTAINARRAEEEKLGNFVPSARFLGMEIHASAAPDSSGKK